jgi:hypothetical protein
MYQQLFYYSNPDAGSTGLPLEPFHIAPGAQEQDITLSNPSTPMDDSLSVGGRFANDTFATVPGEDLKRRVLRSESSKPISVALESLLHVPSTGHLVFNSSMEAVKPRRLGPRSRADKDAALHLKRAGGACPRHKASKKKVSQWL